MHMNKYTYSAIAISTISILGYRYILGLNLPYILIGAVSFLLLKGLSDSGYLNRRIIFSYSDSSEATIKTQKSLTLEAVFEYIRIASKNIAKRVGSTILPISVEDLCGYIDSNSGFNHCEYGLKEELEYALYRLSSAEVIKYAQNIISPISGFRERITCRLVYDEIMSNGTFLLPKHGSSILRTNRIIIPKSRNIISSIKEHGHIQIITLNEWQKIKMLNQAKLPYKNNELLLNGILSGKVVI